MPRPSDIRLSIIVPAYNEADRIERSLELLTDFLDKQSYKSEILVVADGSGDQTLPRISRSALWRTYINALDNRVHRGKGAAVRRGMLSANGEILLYVEPHLATPIDQLPRLLEAFEAGSADVAIGSRRLPGSTVRDAAPFLARVGSAVYASLARATVVPAIQDPLCGFKLFRREAAFAIFPRQRLDRDAFDVEVIRIARRLGYQVAEVPTTWSYQRPREHRPFLGAVEMTFDLVRIRYYDARGLYAPSDPATDGD